VNRFKETRRRHPLADIGSVTEGIARERELLQAVERRADLLIDTTELTPSRLRRSSGEEFITARRRS